MTTQTETSAVCKYNSIESLQSYLTVIKSLTKDDLDQEYYELMTSAKALLGDNDPRMAQFYYDYGNYLLEKIERNGELFGTFKPTKQQKQQQITEVNQSDQESEQPAHAKKPNPNGNVCYQDGDVIIEEDSAVKKTATAVEVEGSPLASEQKILQSDEKEKHDTNDNPQKQTADDDDQQVCLENLTSCLEVLLSQESKLLNGEITMSQEEVDKLIEDLAKVKGRLGDFSNVKENFEQALADFDDAIQYRRKLKLKGPDRIIASLELTVGNTYLYQGNEGCQDKAIESHLKAVNLLTDILEIRTQTKDYPRAYPDKLANVHRLMYLPKWDDSEEVKQLKLIISEILDKIEDTEIQRTQFAELKKVKEEQKKAEELNTQNTFQPTPQNVPVISLGTFGNAHTLIKRKAPLQPTTKESTPTQEDPAEHIAKRAKEE